MAVELADEAATTALAEDVAAILAAGDSIALWGELGAGKTTFARALIRTLADDPALEVPSPTFTLVQSYAAGRLTVAHFDLYRLAAPEELDELGLDEALAGGAVLIEWPDRAGPRLPARRLDITLDIAGEGRRASIVGGASLVARLSRSRAARAFLDRSGWTGAARRHLKGDASIRRYERIRRDSVGGVLMDWPRAVSPPRRDPRLAFRARDVKPFIAVDHALRRIGLSAPDIYAADIDQGFLLLEDLGSDGVLRDGAPVPERYRLAIDVLAAIHAQPRERDLPLPDGGIHRLPAYSTTALSAEVEMFVDWYLPLVHRPTTAGEREGFGDIWREATARLETAEPGWVLLDYHSPNLLWLAERSGLARLGILDFQDMMIGPSAYDVASLCQDARATVPPALERELRERYVALRRSENPRFDAGAFAEAYAILAAQRATKVLGVFARLAVEGGKPGYLVHLPRLREYLERTLAHPALRRYADWYRRLPPPAAA
jgi:hypothetical protein